MGMNTNSLSLNGGAGQYLIQGGWPAAGITGYIGSGNWTLECWIKTVQGNSAAILSGDQGFNDSRSFRLNIDSQKVNAAIFYSGNASINIQGNAVVNDGVWHHIALVADYTSGTDLKLYIDTVLDAHVTDGSARHPGGGSSNAQFMVGADRYFNPENLYTGQIDEIRGFQNAQSQAQIIANYMTELVGNESGLFLYYKLNNTYQDSGPNGLGINPSGTPTFTTDVPFVGTSTSTSSSTSTTTTSTSTTTSTTTTLTSTSTTTTSTSTTTTSTSTTSTTSTSTTTTLDIIPDQTLEFAIENIQ